MELKARRLERGFFEGRGDTGVVWLGMAGVGINVRGTVLLIDPLLVVYERPPARPGSAGGSRGPPAPHAARPRR